MNPNPDLGSSVAGSAVAATPVRPETGLLAPTFLFAFYLMASAAAGTLLGVGMRLYGLSAGGTASASLAAVAAIALGAALGSHFGGRAAASTPNPVANLATLQLCFGLAVGASTLFFRMAQGGYVVFWPVLGGTPAGTWGLRFCLALALFLFPAACYFAMLPIFGRLLFAGTKQLAIATGFAIGLALAGGALGLLAAGTVLIPDLGLRGGALMGIAFCGIAAGGTILVRRRGLEGPGALGANLIRSESAAREPEDDDVLLDEETMAGIQLAVSNMLIGFSGWVYYIAWSRTLTFIAGGTAPARAVVGAVFLAGLALGALLLAGLAERLGPLMMALAGLLTASSLFAYLSMHFVPAAALLYLRLTPLMSRPALSLLPALAVAVSLTLPACLPLGGALTLLPLAAQANRRPMARTIVFLAMGAGLAELLVALTILPAFGVRRTVSLAAALGLIPAILFLGAAPFRRPTVRTTLSLALLGGMIALGTFPAAWDPRIVGAGLYRYGERALARFGDSEKYLAARRGVEVLFYREGRDATAMVERTLQSAGDQLPPIETLALTVDGKIEATTGDDARAQVLQAHIPMLMHGPAERVLLIDYLCGVTAGSVLRHPVKSVTILEREPALFEAASLFTEYNHRPLEDSRVTRIVDEARARLYADRTKYDVIVVGSMEPWLPKDAALLTGEGYRLLKSRLRPGGLLAQRVALAATSEAAIKSILRTFAGAFPEIAVFQISPEDLLVLGSSEPLSVDVGWFKNVLSSSASVSQDLARVLPLGANGLLLEFRLGGESLRSILGDGPENDDDRSAVEVASYRPLTIHDNGPLLAEVNGHWADLVPHLKNYGASPKERAGFLYDLAKAYLGVVTDPDRAHDLARELTVLGFPIKARWITGEAKLQQGDVDGALGEWRAVLEAEPDNLDALFSLGTYYLDSNDHWQAEGYLARAARLYADTPVVLYTHGRNLYVLERYRDAVEEFRQVRAMPTGLSQFPVIDYLEGMARLKLGESAAAASDLEAYLKWANKQTSLTRLEVDAHLKLAEMYDKLGKRFQAQQERQKGNDLLRKIQAYAQRRSAAAGSGPEVTDAPASGSTHAKP